MTILALHRPETNAAAMLDMSFLPPSDARTLLYATEQYGQTIIDPEQEDQSRKYEQTVENLRALTRAAFRGSIPTADRFDMSAQTAEALDASEDLGRAISPRMSTAHDTIYPGTTTFAKEESFNNEKLAETTVIPADELAFAGKSLVAAMAFDTGTDKYKAYKIALDDMARNEAAREVIAHALDTQEEQRVSFASLGRQAVARIFNRNK